MTAYISQEECNDDPQGLRRWINVNFAPLEIVSRYRDPQLQVGQNWRWFNVACPVGKTSTTTSMALAMLAFTIWLMSVNNWDIKFVLRDFVLCCSAGPNNIDMGKQGISSV